MFGVRYVGGVGDFDVFWLGAPRRMVVKWADAYGLTCPASDDGADILFDLDEINKRLEIRDGPKMTEEEYEVLCAIRKLFVVE